MGDGTPGRVAGSDGAPGGVGDRDGLTAAGTVGAACGRPGRPDGTPGRVAGSVGGGLTAAGTVGAACGRPGRPDGTPEGARIRYRDGPPRWWPVPVWCVGQSVGGSSSAAVRRSNGPIQAATNSRKSSCTLFP